MFVEALALDGLNYYVEVKEKDNNTNHAILHFLFWSSKLDFSGSLNDIYLATLGTLLTLSLCSNLLY